MGFGFNPFENFTEDEDEGLRKFIPSEESAEGIDIESNEYKKIKREVKKDHKTADPEVIERLIREKLEGFRLEVEKS